MRLLLPVFLSLPFILLVGCNSKQDLFRLVPGSESGIDFANNIHESDSFNILTYEYIYNGGGVALGDFNGDGKQDIFFTGNSEPNRLYLNEGNLKFRDVTDVAQVGADDFWCAGVATIDINQDGWMDLYIATNTKEDISYRTNLLYINQGLNEDGIPTFSEEAATYGLADTSNAMNAVFFDYDNDLDLDVFIIVNQMQDLRAQAPTGINTKKCSYSEWTDYMKMYGTTAFSFRSSKMYPRRLELPFPAIVWESIL